MEQSKACSRCKQILPYEAFNKKALTPTGLNSACRNCANEMKRNITPEQRERKNAKNRHYRKTNAEAVKATNRNQYLAKREERIAYADAWINNNRKKHNSYQIKNRYKHRERDAAYARARRAKKKYNGVFYVSLKETKALLSKPCFYCNERNAMTIDHVIAINKGGRDSIGNLVPACKSCNSSKQDLTIMEWRLRQMKKLGR